MMTSMTDVIGTVVKRLGIHVRLLVTAVLLISASTFVLGYVGIKTVNTSVQSRFEERIRFLAKYLAMNAELGILIDEKTILSRLAASLLDEKDIARVQIQNSARQTLADASREIRGPFAVEEREVLLQELTDGSDVFQAGIIKEAEPVVGRVIITYSTGEIADLLSTMRRKFVILSAGLALLSAVIFFFISHSIVAPVSNLVEVAREVSHGDYEARVDPGSLPETKELAHAFNEMLDSVENSRNALREAYRRMSRQRTLAEIGKFSMMIAHEVKNPLAIISSSFGILIKDQVIGEDNLMRSFIEDELVRLNRLIEDFLLFSRPSEPRFSKVDLNGMVQDIVARFEIQNGPGQISFRTTIPDDPFWVDADVDLLSRAVSNIVKNACEANEGQGFVDISIEPGTDMWHLGIRDQGEGIDSDVMAKLFEPFFTTKSKGTGLGLAFVQHVIKAHNGSISAGNHPEKGAVFTVQLPRNDD
ncbi:MAG: ATP-binding protein [Pseudomonadota bacterium]